MYLGLTYVDHEPYGPPERRHKNAFMNLTTYIKYLDFENMFFVHDDFTRHFHDTRFI
jgi:hypothetical protein